MPEGPEVANFVKSLNRFAGKSTSILGVTPISGRYTKKPIEGLTQTTPRFPLLISKIGCKGKLIYFEFDSHDVTLINTLGMSGSWSDRQRNARVVLHTSNGDLYFNDPRNFGTLKFTDRAGLKKKLNTLGPDMLNENISPQQFIERLRKFPKLTMCEALMNQGVVSGVGNYLKADSLWLAKLSPHRLVSQSTDEQLTVLCESVKSTIRTAYANGGSTILTYKGFDGEEGGHQMIVYGRKTDPEGNQVVAQETRDGRTTWWAPSVQV